MCLINTDAGKTTLQTIVVIIISSSGNRNNSCLSVVVCMNINSC